MHKFFLTGKLSALTLLLLALVLVIFRCIAVPDHQLGWDAFGYYLYLPAQFIYGDLSLSDRTWLDALMLKYNPSSTLYQLVDLENGKHLIKYTSGTAVLLAPFFFLAHMFAHIAGFPADGLSLPYQYVLTSGGMVYALIGLVFFRKVLLEYFSDKLAALLLLLIVLGTNYFQLTAFDGTLITHNFLFTLYAILIWHTIKWHLTPRMHHAIWTGLSLGFIILVRPSEMPAILIPLLWGISGATSLKSKFTLIIKESRQVWVAVFCVLLVGSVQMIYWKHVSDNWIFYSYTNAGEGFELSSPYLAHFLFSFRKGWFIYTPLMIFSILGFAQLYREKKELFVPILMCTITSIWIMSSWTTWWYAGGSFSSRTMTPLYVLLALPLGYKIRSSWRKSIEVKVSIFVLFLAFVLLNLFQTWQWRHGIIDREGMTSEYYWAIFGRCEAPENAERLKMVGRSLDGQDQFTDSSYYSTRTLFDLEKDVLRTLGEESIVINEKSPFSPGPDVRFGELTEFDHVWVSIEIEFNVPVGYAENPPVLVTAMYHEGESYKYHPVYADPEYLIKGGKINMRSDYLTPEVRDPNDQLKAYLWHTGQAQVEISKMVVELREPKDPSRN